MHSALILVTLLVAYWLRWRWCSQPAPWEQRWRAALVSFCLPPLLLISTAIAILWMGHRGSMLGLPVQPYGCWLGAAGLGIAAGAVLAALIQSLIHIRALDHQPIVTLGKYQARYLPTSAAFAAQMGFWQPQLVVSQGLLNHLSEAEIQAVLAHERAHLYFRDTFWFFWLGWLRRFSCWLPQTDTLWQELLLLRELRADGWAAQRVDSLLLAEVLVKLVALPLEHQPSVIEALSHTSSPSRLEQRVTALMTGGTPTAAGVYPLELLAGLVPLASVLLHS